MTKSNPDRGSATLESAWQSISDCRSELMGLAMLWVMLFHAYQFHFQSALPEFFKSMGFFGVDVFILLSGMGLGKSLLEKSQEPLKSFYSRRFQRILPTYWLLVGPYSLLLVLAGRIPISTAAWNMTALHYWFHIPNSFNWYVPALLVFYLLAPFYVRLFTRCPYKRLLSAATIPLSYLLYRLSIPLNLLHLQDFVFRIPSFALGVLLGWFLFTRHKCTRSDLLYVSALALAGGTLGGLLAARKLYIHPCYIFNLLMLFLVLLLSVLLRPCRKTLLCRGLAALGTRSFEIYLINVIITREFPVLVARLGLSSLPIWAAYGVLYAGNLIGAFVLHRLVAHLHLRPRNQ